MKRFQGLIASAGVIAAVVAHAHADTVYVQIEGDELGRGVAVSLSGGFTFADGAASKILWAGGRSLLVDGLLVRAYSAELTSADGDGWYEESLVQAGPSEEKARAVGALFAGHADSLDDADEAATFQAMLWEIVYDYDGSDRSIDMAGGNVAFGMINGALFDDMKSTALRGDSRVPVALLSNDAYNNMFRIVPLPSVAALAGLGLLGLAGRNPRRR